MNNKPVQPGQLLVRLVIYYGVMIGLLVAVIKAFPAVIDYVPVGGDPDFSLTKMFSQAMDPEVTARGAAGKALSSGLSLLSYLVGAVLAALPLTWVYMATNQGREFSSNFVRTILILPICATSTVLLVKDSLALAFGLAALVAAIRFRIRLADPLDGIYILAAIAVGLAAGISYVGVGLVTTFFFAVIATLLWATNYGRNPVEDQKRASKAAKAGKQSVGDTP